MRNIVENISQDFFEILRYDKNQWFDYWKIYKKRHEPLIENYEKLFGLNEETVKQILLSFERRFLDKLYQKWQIIQRENKYLCSQLVSHKPDVFQLEKEDFSIFLAGLLGKADWTVVEGKQQAVILIDLVSLENKKILEQLPHVAYQATIGFRKGEKFGNFVEKEKIFEELLPTLLKIIDKNNLQKALEDICSVLYENISYYNWVGFYLVDKEKPNELVLGPYRGEPTEHVRIPFGKGICGQAAATGMTFVVQDVSKETNYLSCSPKVKSEIVVPIKVDGKIVGELDIDSHLLSPFDEFDKIFLNKICEKLSEKFKE
ncbi:GAF domain-containing protein [Pseudothermotoga thermarum]|uniref:Putative GAF sensor protein n=1 Tax=Pseudothermotoga thermarum DSM 5069 TaxID=688269 RepID=F7YV65_9THEM|nr:GAF domain-containing protein [Pseudothermotoga thermarum]AEH50364.1 putative GAF sensor protein [Pseudothermotoga thermarum DSM 5069]